jgi:hypothetical protein
VTGYLIPEKLFLEKYGTEELLVELVELRTM